MQPQGAKVRWYDLPIHPLVVAAYAVLSIFALNVEQVRAAAMLRALVVSLVGGMLLWTLTSLACRDWRRGAILTSLLLALFFSYGHLYHLLEARPVLGMELGRHRLLGPVYILVVVLAVWGVGWKLHLVKPLNRIFNLVSLTLMLFPLLQLAGFGIGQLRPATGEPAQTAGTVSLRAGDAPPDVYYIILDGYTRADVLQERFDYDNSAFLQDLQALGFYVAECSQSNYTQTLLSLTSSLNMVYLDALGEGNWTQNTELYGLVQHNAVMETFKGLGYRTIAFETGYYWLNLEEANYYFSPTTQAVNTGESRLPVNGFEAMLIRESAGLVLTDLLSFLPENVQPDLEYPNRYHRERVLYQLEKLQTIPYTLPGPKFTYAHIIAPHSPIVFGPQGEWVVLPEGLSDEGWRQAHTDEIQYVNQRVLELVTEIISTSARPPVIILQADHGAMLSDQENHAQILNAYYLPGDGEAGLYPSITPVNTFRLVFNRYFDAQFPLLEDLTYRSYYDTPFDFVLLDGGCP